MHKVDYAGRVRKNAIPLQDGLKWGQDDWNAKGSATELFFRARENARRFWRHDFAASNAR
jgi:hypothetical protein